MLPPEYIAQIKQISLPGYLAHKGFQPVKQQGNQLLYLSPFRNESTPSFYVNQDTNVFKDFGDPDLRGDVIRLVQLLNQCRFADAVHELEKFSNLAGRIDFSFSGLSSRPTKRDEIKSVKLLGNKSLVAYVESRRISFKVARKYLKEVYYTHRQTNLFALGFENDKGGYELRTRIAAKEVKRCIGPKAITTIPGKNPRAINLFEGFFDFLSTMELFKQVTPGYTTVVLNSTALLEQALPILPDFPIINAYLDNDETGRQTLEQLRQTGLPVRDCSHFYEGYKDMNESWQARINDEPLY